MDVTDEIIYSLKGSSNRIKSSAKKGAGKKKSNPKKESGQKTLKEERSNARERNPDKPGEGKRPKEKETKKIKRPPRTKPTKMNVASRGWELGEEEPDSSPKSPRGKTMPGIEKEESPKVRRR